MLPVISEMILPSEGFAAYVARVRPLVGVRPLVDEEIVALGELSAAKLTNKLFLGPGRPASPWYTRVHRGDRGVLGGRGRGRGRGRRAARGGRRGRREDGARGRGTRRRRRRRRRRARAITIPLGYSSQKQLVMMPGGRRGGATARHGRLARQEFRGE